MQNIDVIFARQVAREAGALIVHGRAGLLRLTDKLDGEAVTNLDREVNAFILAQIESRYPADDILSEEDDPVEKGRGTRLWLVDPIDGTVNMMQGIPFYCVSIGLWVDGEPRGGVVYDPVHDELFEAAIGEGAWLNGERLEVSDVALEGAVVLHGEPYNKREANTGVRRVERVRDASLYDRELGSAALMLCYVACRRADIVCITGSKPWDYAAGAVIVLEAGGRVTDFSGTRWQLQMPQIIAGNEQAHAESLTRL